MTDDLTGKTNESKPDPKPAAATTDHDAVDGCVCGIEHDSHTADHELPAARGGVEAGRLS